MTSTTNGFDWFYAVGHWSTKRAAKARELSAKLGQPIYRYTVINGKTSRVTVSP
jgi:hypothetical protein